MKTTCHICETEVEYCDWPKHLEDHKKNGDLKKRG